MTQHVTIIGAGLAGSEAAYQLLKRGFNVHMIEMRPNKLTPAHTTALFGELVCSNSLRSDDADTNAVGLMHQEMRRCDSLIMKCADANAVPAGGALAVNRDLFSRQITETLHSFPGFTLDIQEADFPEQTDTPVIIATGPLTSDKMATGLREITQTDALHFFDAIAPIVYTDSVDMTKAWYQSRYDKGDGTDYLNCPLSKQEYNDFIDALLAGEKVHAVVQLRKENKQGTLMNLVGFQTKLTYGAQKQVFRMIPALANAEFARLGGIHRNTFVCGPKVLTDKLALKGYPNIRLAGQLTGCEGYIESASIGLLAGLFTALPDLPPPLPDLPPPPAETALGAMLRHITIEAEETLFQPMNINFGLFPEIEAFDERGKKVKGTDRKKRYTERARQALTKWIQQIK